MCPRPFVVELRLCHGDEFVFFSRRGLLSKTKNPWGGLGDKDLWPSPPSICWESLQSLPILSQGFDPGLPGSPNFWQTHPGMDTYDIQTIKHSWKDLSLKVTGQGWGEGQYEPAPVSYAILKRHRQTEAGGVGWWAGPSRGKICLIVWPDPIEDRASVGKVKFLETKKGFPLMGSETFSQ